MSRRSGLGRGLGALIPSDLVSEDHEAFRELPLSAIEPNRYQPREHFDEAGLVALSESIRELGVLQPVLVRPMEGDSERFELIAGERRWRAARKAGLSAIPAIVRTVTDTTSLEQALVENLHRADLNPLEEGAAYQQLMEDFGFTQEQVAARVGKSRPAVANTLRLLQLPATTQRLVAEGRLSAGHARALLGTADRTLQDELARLVIEENWSVRQLEEAVRRAALAAEQAFAPPAAAPPPPQAPAGVELQQSPTPSPVPPSSDRSSQPVPGVSTAGAMGLSGSTGSTSSPESSPRPAPVPQPERTLPPAGLLELEQLLTDYFDTSVRISTGRGRGKLTIDFADIADLERIYRLIVDEG